MDIYYSVVIPLYNKKNYIARAINSVLNQTYENFELIIVDDSSTDGSLEIVRSFQDERIKVFQRNQPGAGGYAARNYGIEVSTYDYIAFLDADDEWSDNYLETVKNSIINYPDIKIFCSNYLRKDTESKIFYNKFYLRIGKRKGTHILQNFFTHTKFWPMLTSFTVIHKSVFKDAGNFPEGKCKRNGDTETWMRIALKFNILWINNTGGIYHMDCLNMVTTNIPWLDVPYVKDSAENILPSLSKKESKLVKKYVNYNLGWRIKKAILKKCDISFLLKAYYKDVNRLKYFAFVLLSRLPYFLLKIIKKI